MAAHQVERSDVGRIEVTHGLEGDGGDVTESLCDGRWHRGPEPSVGDQLVVAMRQPQLIAWRTPQIGYHNFDHRTKIGDAMAMATKLGVDYFAVPTGFSGFTRSSEFRRRYEFGDGTLTISVMNANGGATSRATFRK